MWVINTGRIKKKTFYIFFCSCNFFSSSSSLNAFFLSTLGRQLLLPYVQNWMSANFQHKSGMEFGKKDLYTASQGMEFRNLLINGSNHKSTTMTYIIYLQHEIIQLFSNLWFYYLMSRKSSNKNVFRMWNCWEDFWI